MAVSISSTPGMSPTWSRHGNSSSPPTAGGWVVVLDFLAGVSTAGMIERMGEGRTDR